ncbi:MAG: hypothetical protein F6K50_07960 [Moorea sp. SIO3I7]|uniref:CDP-alcohol phosphatidyltransferase family protein n=1 Tax=unclassified Moorena TaxID=2683338 RepID=UPI0013C0DF0A|nr:MULTISPECIES: CDP-alcohol phosphatidyltransferase family protein [unclassified Moorena]NEN95462.1 hypothetical protein [Moorena sp. SIO3I7]NEO06482.1 hypothetical protein [Moorena sp. SIO3I8]NEQ59529.1 hypothetical protein [Moorena sp. SIO4A1]
MQYIPNFLSLVRLIGSLGVCVQVSIYGDLRFVITMLAIGIVTDLLDGYLARRLECVTVWGHRLDIIADVSSFALLPCTYIWLSDKSLLKPFIIIPILVYAIYRIQTKDWQCKGIPLPVVGMFLFGTLLLFGQSFISYFLVGIIITFSFLSIIIERLS